VDENEELASLLTKARQGNNEALATLLDRLRPWVRQCAQRQLGQGLGARLDGSDIAQEVQARAWREFGHFDGQTVPELRAWVEKILENFVTDCRRHHRAAKRDAGAEIHGTDLIAGLLGAGTTPSQGAMRNEDEARVAEARQRLTEQQRLVFQLRLEGLSFEEVGRRAGMTAGNARVAWCRAVKRLTDDLGDAHE
jgi:RNA polymerase sigma-70 factor (ECF subfamily)